MFFNFFRELDEKYHKDDEELNRVMAHFQFMLLGENYIHDYILAGSITRVTTRPPSGPILPHTAELCV